MPSAYLNRINEFLHCFLLPYKVAQEGYWTAGEVLLQPTERKPEGHSELCSNTTEVLNKVQRGSVKMSVIYSHGL